jgi:BirA family biotin operon repressor/biotin-[acetyl-CoA-carboxylase] ligase
VIYDGIEPADLAARLRAPSCLALATVTSTLDLVHELAAEEAPAGTVVLADEQVRGRGRMGRRWHSPKGAGVWLGYLMRPGAPLEGGVLSLRVGLAVIDALDHLGVEARLKWPNDIVADDRKLGGILCEARWLREAPSWVAVGIGLNVHGPLPAEIAEGAVTLEELHTPVSRVGLLEALVPRLHGLAHTGALTDAERNRFATRDWLLGRTLVEPMAGTARGIGADGALLVETKVGVERVLGGSVVVARHGAWGNTGGMREQPKRSPRRSRRRADS